MLTWSMLTEWRLWFLMGYLSFFCIPPSLLLPRRLVLVINILLSDSLILIPRIIITELTNYVFVPKFLLSVYHASFGADCNKTRQSEHFIKREADYHVAVKLTSVTDDILESN